MDKKICFIIFFVCILLYACGSVTSNEANSTSAIQATGTIGNTKKPLPTHRRDSETGMYAEPYVASYTEKENVIIQGRKYSYIKYAYEAGQIRIICLWSDEDELVFPSEIDSEKVYLVGSYKSKNEIPKNLQSQKENDMTLAWQQTRSKRYKRIVIPEGVGRITNGSFQGVNADVIELPSSMYDTGGFAFAHSKINKVIVKNPEMRISYGSFASSAVREIQLPESYAGEIEDGCFQNSKLESFTWPLQRDRVSQHDMPQVGNAVFADCKDLKEIRFPENQPLIDIPEYSFIGCTALKELVFPASTGKVRYASQPYADDYPEGGVETLRFLGMETELDTCSYVRSLDERHLVTAGRIMGPKGSKVIEYAKRSMKMKSIAKGIRKEVSEYAVDGRVSKENCPTIHNFSVIEYESKVKFIPIVYEETE